MEKNAHSPSSYPSSSGLIRLQAQFTDLTTLLAPTWALICGLIASEGFGQQGRDWLRLALLILLVDGGWGTLWAALGDTDWTAPLRRWRDWHKSEPLPRIPYTSSGSPGNHLAHWLGQLHTWWHEVLWPSCGEAISAVLIALPVTAILGALLGPDLLLLSLGVLAAIQLGLAWEGGRGTTPSGWDAIIAVTLPWLAGHITFGPLTLHSVGLAILFATAWGSAWHAESIWGRMLCIGGQILAGAMLVGLHRPLMAGLTALLLVPQIALLPRMKHGPPHAWYVRHARPWLMAAMVIAAWAL